MWVTNVKVVAVVAVVIGFYTMVAHMIPQVESEVPQALDLTGGVTAEALTAAGEGIFNGAGACAACHGTGTRAPNLVTDHAGEGVIGARCATRAPGADCKAYLYEALTEPGAYVVPGFDNIMPDMRRQFTADQIWAVVAYLESLGGTVTVSAADIERTGSAASSQVLATVAPPAGGTANPLPPSAPAPVSPSAPAGASASASPAATAASAPEVASTSRPTPSPAASPAAQPSVPAADPKTQARIAEGETIFNGPLGCAVCHDGTGNLAPNLLTDHLGQGPIGARCGSRAPGKDCYTYLYQSLTEPSAFLVEGYRDLMPTTQKQLTDEQVGALVAYLQSLGGKVTLPGAPAAASPGRPASSPAAQVPPAAADPNVQARIAEGETIFNGPLGCAVCHDGTGNLAPNLLTDHQGQGPIGVRCVNRERGKDCNAYLYQSLTEPSTFLVEGYRDLMPTARKQLTDEQVWALVAYLQSLGGKVTVPAAGTSGAAESAIPRP